MSENSDLRNNTGKSSSNGQKSKIPGSIIIVILVVALALLAFSLANNRLAAGTRLAGDGSPGPVGSSCCSIESYPAADNENSIAAALEYYRANYSSIDGLQARVEDFGCHQEIAITRDNQLLKRFGYSGGTFYELAP